MILVPNVSKEHTNTKYKENSEENSCSSKHYKAFMYVFSLFLLNHFSRIYLKSFDWGILC